jgi:autotransporter-associated beta strand protein
LAASARINAAVGDLVLSNTGTITGDGFTLTLDGRGVGNSVSSVIGTGSGALIKEGSGTWSLFGANSYSGGTTISGGTLQFGDGANSGAVGEGAIDNNGILKFSRRDDIVVTNTISGTGSRHFASW